MSNATIQKVVTRINANPVRAQELALAYAMFSGMICVGDPTFTTLQLAAQPYVVARNVLKQLKNLKAKFDIKPLEEETAAKQKKVIKEAIKAIKAAEAMAAKTWGVTKAC